MVHSDANKSHGAESTGGRGLAESLKIGAKVQGVGEFTHPTGVRRPSAIP